MSLSFSRIRLAHALAFIAEAGLEGFTYYSAAEAAARKTYRSSRKRWSVRSSPEFSAEEFRQYLSIAATARMIDAAQHTEEIAAGGYSVDPSIIRLTFIGWTHLEEFDRPVLHRWVGNIIQNIPTVLVTLIASWALYYFGAPR